MINEQNYFDQPVKNYLGKSRLVKEMITQLVVYQTIPISQKVIAIDLHEQQALNSDQKAIQQVHFTGNLHLDGNAKTTMFFLIEKAKETILDFSQRSVRVL